MRLARPPSVYVLRVGLLDVDGAAYWWDYDNTGLRLAQLCFYEVPTTVGTTP